MKRILISIPSFCDSELTSTVQDLFKNANQPESLTIVICHQNESEELTNIDRFFKQYPRHQQIHLTNYHYTEAKGPIFARHKIQELCQSLSLHNNHDYFLSIDSHMRFIKDWDQKLIQQYEMCSYEKAIISCYPGEYITLMDMDIIKWQNVPNFLSAERFDSNQMLRIVGKKLPSCPSTPIECNFVAAGFYFGPISLITNCPYPNDYDFLFFGEELLMSCLFFNKGYKVFCPAMTMCYHLWERSQRSRTIFDIQNNEQKFSSQQKLIQFLKTQKDFIDHISTSLPQTNNPFTQSIKNDS